MAATAYAQLADINSHFTNFTIGASTSPSTSEVEEWLELYYSRINGLCSSKGISVPIDSSDHPNAYHIVKHMNEMAVAALVAEAIYYGVEPAESDQAERYWADYMRDWDKIENNPHYLYDASITRPAFKSYAIEEHSTADDAPQPRVDFDDEF